MLLSRETKLAHKEREMAKRLKSDHELKWSTRHEQPLISQLISRMLGGLSVSAQSWSICPPPSGHLNGWNLTSVHQLFPDGEWDKRPS